MGVTVRRRQDGDLAALVEALHEVHRTDAYPLYGDHVTAQWLAEDNEAAWVGEIDGRLAGHVAVTRSPGHGDPPQGAAMTLARLFVTPSGRGRGVAGALLDTADAYAEERELLLDLWVMEDAAAAVRLYESRGWRLVEREEAGWYRGDGPRPWVRRYVR